MTLRLVFHAINGTGVGHLSRVVAIHQRISDSEPLNRSLVVTSSRYTQLLEFHDVPFVRLPSNYSEPVPGPAFDLRALTPREYGDLLAAIVDSWGPSGVVLDTHPPVGFIEQANRRGIPVVLSLRKTRTSVLRSMRQRGTFDALAAVLLPHYEDELAWGDGSDEWVRFLEESQHASVIGPMVRNVSAQGAASRSAVLVTSGGGGYHAEARRLRMSAIAAVERLRLEGSRLRLHVVRGPYGGAPEALPAFAEWIDPGPALPGILGNYAAVVSHAGYNSTHEAIRSGVPLVLSPGHRQAEDQRERATWAAHAGLAHLADEAGPGDVYDALSRALEDGDAQRERQLARYHQLDHRAASVLLAALGVVSREGVLATVAWSGSREAFANGLAHWWSERSRRGVAEQDSWLQCDVGGANPIDAIREVDDMRQQLASDAHVVVTLIVAHEPGPDTLAALGEVNASWRRHGYAPLRIKVRPA